MTKTTLLSALLLVAACGPKPTPRDRYVQALNAKLEGDSEAYYDGLVALAYEEPHTRAGRRARATLQGESLLTQLTVLGVLAAVAVPAFTRYEVRARQAEPKANLEGLCSAIKARQAETSRPCTSFAECGFTPERGARYFYYLARDEVAGGDGAEDPELLRLRADAALDELGVRPGVGPSGFLVAAVGDPDDDGEVDVWTIDQDEHLVNRRNDLE